MDVFEFQESGDATPRKSDLSLARSLSTLATLPPPLIPRATPGRPKSHALCDSQVYVW